MLAFPAHRCDIDSQNGTRNLAERGIPLQVRPLGVYDSPLGMNHQGTVLSDAMAHEKRLLDLLCSALSVTERRAILAALLELDEIIDVASSQNLLEG